jgi:hypothetical protein
MKLKEVKLNARLAPLRSDARLDIGATLAQASELALKWSEKAHDQKARFTSELGPVLGPAFAH